MEYLGKITDARQHEHQVVMCTARKDEYICPEKWYKIYLVENIVCEADPLVPTSNGLLDHFMIPK